MIYFDGHAFTCVLIVVFGDVVLLPLRSPLLVSSPSLALCQKLERYPRMSRFNHVMSILSPLSHMLLASVTGIGNVCRCVEFQV